MDFRTILYDTRDHIAKITINRPEAYNAYNTPCLVELREAFRDATFDDHVGVIVITGAGEKAFCTGGDVKEYAEVYTRYPRDYWKYMSCFQEALDAIAVKHPLGLGSADDLVGAYSYLASDASRWTTGSAIVVDGGYAAP